MKIKLLFLAPHLSTGGMPSFLLKRIETLLEHTDCFEIFVAEYEYYGELFVVHRNKIKNLIGNNFYSLRENKMQVMEIIRTEEIDIVHIDEMPELMDNDRLFKDLYRNDRKWRIVETCHNISFNPDISKVYHPDLYLFCTPYHEQTFADMKSFYNTIEFPIDNNKPSWIDKTNAKEELAMNIYKKHVVNIGLWTRGKNQGEGLEIARKYPDMMFHFVGNQAGNFQDYWEPLMKDLPSNVKIWGERSDTDKFLLAADIFMFNSTWECNPLVLREAISYRLPIIARNLPQYVDMFTDYLNPIDTDLNKLECNYNVPSNNTSEVFALKHKESYTKLLEKPMVKQEVEVIQHFVDNPYLEIKGANDSNFTIIFYENDIAHYQETIKSNHWIKLNRQYYTKWRTKVWQDGELIYENTIDLENKKVYIAFESKSLGDTLAWMPYVEEFRKIHKCRVVCSTFWNHLFDYPEIEFVEPTTEVHNLYALYRIGYFDDLNKLPYKPTSIPLQKVACDALGLEFKEIKPKLIYVPKVPKEGKYATIATNSTAGCKFWTKEGWQNTINWLMENGYEVYNTSKEPNPFDNCTQITTPSLESKMDWIAGSEFFIGLSSGLTWLAWAMGKKVIMISNFTEEWNEFNCYRVTNKSVCNGCWNNPNFKFDPGDWLWCPVHKGTNKQFICHSSITPEMVINQIKHAMG